MRGGGAACTDFIIGLSHLLLLFIFLMVNGNWQWRGSLWLAAPANNHQLMTEKPRKTTLLLSGEHCLWRARFTLHTDFRRHRKASARWCNIVFAERQWLVVYNRTELSFQMQKAQRVLTNYLESVMTQTWLRTIVSEEWECEGLCRMNRVLEKQSLQRFGGLSANHCVFR